VTTPAEPIAVKVTRYRCPFCTRGWSSKKRAAEHDPAKRNCKTCVYHQPFAPSASVCLPGALCACDEQPEECLLGEDISDGLRSGCPLWSSAGEAQ
jgi:hypothetical protein